MNDASRRGAAAVCLGLVLLSACSPSRKKSSPRDAGTSSSAASSIGAVPEPGSANSAAALPDPAVDAGSLSVPAVEPTLRSHTLRVQQLEGRVDSETPLQAGGTVSASSSLTLARGARLTLALDDHVRIVLVGPLVARALPDGAPAMLVREGSFSVDVAPRGQRVGTAFWLATPLARVDVADSARMFLRVAARGGGELALVSGHASFAQPESASLLAGVVAHCVGAAGLVELSRPFQTLEQAWEVFSRGPSCAPQKGAPLDAREKTLEAALDAVETRAAREVSWLAEHSRLLALHDPKAQGIREQLAHSAALLSRERRWAAAVRAQREAALLGRTITASESAQLERARALAPYDD